MAMIRTFSKDAEYTGNAAHAIKMFAKKYPEQVGDWIEVYEWMAGEGIDHFNDTRMGDGSYNADWRYSLNLEPVDLWAGEKERWYISLVLRDE